MGLEEELFAFLCRTYAQRREYRHRLMGLQYTTAETHDLAHVVAEFLERRASIHPRRIVERPDHADHPEGEGADRRATEDDGGDHRRHA